MTNTEQSATEGMPQPPSPQIEPSGLSRRQFLVGLGGLGIGAVIGGSIVGLLLPDGVYAIEASDGYLLVDTKNAPAAKAACWPARSCTAARRTYRCRASR